jgi:hypothetical protein
MVFGRVFIMFLLLGFYNSNFEGIYLINYEKSLFSNKFSLNKYLIIIFKDFE